jgi:quercetin dioxygenase-like cupin family protein
MTTDHATGHEHGNDEARFPDSPMFSSWDTARLKFTQHQFNDDPIVHGADAPYEATPMGGAWYYLNGHIFPDRALTDWHTFVMNMPDGTGKHIHQGGVAIYVLEGRGSVVIDGEREDWKAGDLLLLPVRPGGVEHQFFNTDEGKPCRWLAVVHIPMFNQLGSEFTQQDYAAIYGQGVHTVATLDRPIDEEHASASRQDGDLSLPEPIAVFQNGPERRDVLASRNLFADLIRLRDVQRAGWRSRGLRVIAGEYLPWETNPWGVMRWYMHPSLYDTSVRTHIVYEQKIPAGSRTGQIRHQGNSLVYVLEGQGSTVIDGVEHEWRAGDMIQLPARPKGIVFRHHNSSSEQDARLLGFELNTTDMLGVDRGSGLVVLDPAPEAAGS